MAPSRCWQLITCAPKLSLSVCVLLSLMSVAMAQSGRVPKQTPSPPPASPDGGSTAAQTKPSPPLSLLIVNSVNSARAPAWAGVAIRELIARLEESPGVSVSREKDMSRKEAGEFAEKKTGVYVVWIEFQVDASMAMIDRDAEATIVTGLNPGCLFISYVIFEPGTKNMREQKRVYQDGYRAQCTGTAIQPAPQSSGRETHPAIRTLPQAAREAADAIINNVKSGERIAFLPRSFKAELEPLYFSERAGVRA